MSRTVPRRGDAILGSDSESPPSHRGSQCRTSLGQTPRPVASLRAPLLSLLVGSDARRILSNAALYDDLTGVGRGHECVVISLVLIGVRFREPGERVVEDIAGTEIARDRDGVAGAGVRACERPATHFRIGD